MQKIQIWIHQGHIKFYNTEKKYPSSRVFCSNFVCKGLKAWFHAGVSRATASAAVRTYGPLAASSPRNRRRTLPAKRTRLICTPAVGARTREVAARTYLLVVIRCPWNSSWRNIIVSFSEVDHQRGQGKIEVDRGWTVFQGSSRQIIYLKNSLNVSKYFTSVRVLIKSF